MGMERLWKTVRETFRELLPVTDAPPERKHFTAVPAVTLSTLAHFDGIVDELERLVGAQRMLVLSGMPGSGKTSAACALARRMFDPQGLSTALIDADSRESLRHGLVRLGSPGWLNVPGVNAPSGAADVNENEVTRVLDALAGWESWLLILDNMDHAFRDEARYREVEPYLEALRRCRGGRVLITTQDLPVHVVERKLAWFEMPRLDHEVGARFLLERAGMVATDPDVLAQAEAVSRRVDALPLALDQAAAYVHQAQRKRFDYSLGDYLAEHNRAAAEIRRHRPQGEHASSFDTFWLSFRSLPEPTRWALLACALLDPEAIPVELLKACTGAEDIGETLRPAAALRLLAAEGDDVRVHREVHGVLGDILRREAEYQDLPLTVLAGVDALLPRLEMASRLSPHLQMLVDGGWTQRSGADLSQLGQYLEGRTLLRDIESGTASAWEMLLFGSGHASYEAMHRLEREEERVKLAHRLAALRSVCTPENARLIFACVHLTVHYWWDNYLEAAPLAKPLLEIWEKTHREPEDQRLLGALQRLQETYPAMRDYRGRSGRGAAGRWNRTADAVKEILRALDLQEPPGERASSAARYARGILNIYLTEALRYASGDPDHAWPENPTLEELYAEAVDLFERNDDAFHHNWALWEWADYHAEAGERCGQGGAVEAARQHYARACELCREGLQLSVREIELDEEAYLDSEVCSRYYTTLGQAAAGLSGDALTALPYRCAATFTAAVFVLSEEDVYSVAFYREQTDRTLDWLLELAQAKPEAIPFASETLRKWWGRPSLAARTLESALAKRDPERRTQLAELLLPTAIEVKEGSSEGDTDLTHECRSELQSLARVMPRRLARLRPEPMPECLPEVAKALKAQLAAEDEDDEA